MFPRTLPIQTSKPASARMNPRLSLRRLVSQFVEEQRRPCWRKTTGRETLPEGGREEKSRSRGREEKIEVEGGREGRGVRKEGEGGGKRREGGRVRKEGEGRREWRGGGKGGEEGRERKDTIRACLVWFASGHGRNVHGWFCGQGILCRQRMYPSVVVT